jgi:hypothetical protein
LREHQREQKSHDPSLHVASNARLL